MTGYEIYVLILCLIVFTVLTALSAYMLSVIIKLTVRLIRCGQEDAKLKEEVEKFNSESIKRREICRWASFSLNLILCLFLLASFIFSIVVNASNYSVSETAPTFRVVQSTSMSKKLESNKYLSENDLNDQFDMHDIILTYKLPDEFDLRLYDVVVYEVDGVLLVHRIVQIEEPNAMHPDCRHFRLQGDAVHSPDRFPVLYEQMRGIYRGERVRFVGSFITFLHNPAGWLCVMLMVASVAVLPFVENYLQKEKNTRIKALGLPVPAEQIKKYKEQKRLERKARKYGGRKNEKR